MPYSIFDIATALGLEAQGDTDLEVSGVNEPALAASDELALAMKPEFAAQIADGQAQAAMLWQGADWQALGLRAALLAPRPRHALSGLSAMMDPGPGYGGGIHQSAIVDPSARLGEGVSIGPFSIVGAGAEIGAGTIIGPQCHVGWQSRVGAGSLLHTGVRIGARVTMPPYCSDHPT